MKTNYISKVNFYNLKLKKIKNFFNFKLYSNQFKTNTLKLIVKNLSFKTKNSQFSINQVSTKKLNFFYNKSLFFALFLVKTQLIDSGFQGYIYLLFSCAIQMMIHIYAHR